MARMWYAGTAADFTVAEDEANNDALILAPAVELDVYTASSGGTQLTDLLDHAGNPVTEVTTSASGRVLPFQGPDGTTAGLWLDDGSGDRYHVAPHGPHLPLAGGTLTGPLVVVAATAATHAAQVTAIDATTGRLAIGGCEVGDTGARSWGGGTLRRAGMVVTNTGTGTLPDGFRDTYSTGDQTFITNDDWPTTLP